MEFWGDKATACMDLWSLQHVLSGMIAGYLAMKWNGSWIARHARTYRSHPFHVDLVVVLLASYVWETSEHYFETGAFGSSVAHSFHAVEFWANRMVFDPLMMVIGYFIIRKYPKLFIPSVAMAATFLFLHSI